VVTALKNWAFLFAPLSRRKCVALIQIGHALMTVHKSNSSNTWLLKHTHVTIYSQYLAWVQASPTTPLSRSADIFLKLQQNVMNYVFLLFCVQWHWKLCLTFPPVTANLKNVQMAAILTSLGHKILKFYMVSKTKRKFIILSSTYFSSPLQWWGYIH